MVRSVGGSAARGSGGAMGVRSIVCLSVLVVLFSGGCGGDEASQTSGGSEPPTESAAAGADDEAAIEDLVVRWGHADTAEEICDLIGEGFKTAFNATEDCPAALTEAIDAGRMEPESEDLTVEAVKVAGTRAAARVQGD